MGKIECTVEHFLSPLERARYRSMLFYLRSNPLDMGNKKSVKQACDSLNLTPKKLTELIDEFEQDGLISIGDGFPEIDVTLTKTGLVFIYKYCLRQST